MPDPAVLTLDELAALLRVHPSTVYRLLHKKQLPGYKVGRDWRFNVESIEKWRRDLEAQHVAEALFDSDNQP